MEKYLISPSDTVWTALHRLGETAGKCLVVIDEGSQVIGTLSDGDLRRAILQGNRLEDSIEKVYFRSPVILEEGNYSQQQVRKFFQEQRLELIPVIDESGKLSQVLTWNTSSEGETPKIQSAIYAPVVIMAGGRGTRLAPFTTILPKPLIPVAEKPVIQHIIDRFVECGLNEVMISVNYKSKILKAYFEELEPAYSVEFIEESTPLGTAGALGFLKDTMTKTFLVTNCDVIIDIDYRVLMDFHETRKNKLTLVGSTKKIVVPYGSCTLDSQGDLETLEEKPEFKFIVNTGLYVLHPDILEFIPHGKFFQFNELVREVSAAGKKVGVFPISDGDWIDVGEWPEYRKAVAALTS